MNIYLKKNDILKGTDILFNFQEENLFLSDLIEVDFGWILNPFGFEDNWCFISDEDFQQTFSLLPTIENVINSIESELKTEFNIDNIKFISENVEVPKIDVYFKVDELSTHNENDFKFAFISTKHDFEIEDNFENSTNLKLSNYLSNVLNSSEINDSYFNFFNEEENGVNKKDLESIISKENDHFNFVIKDDMI